MRTVWRKRAACCACALVFASAALAEARAGRSSTRQASLNVALIGGPAQRGDNCTPVAWLAIGAPVPRAPHHATTTHLLGAHNNTATVTSQATISVTVPGGEIQGVGWIYGTKGDGYFFSPNLRGAGIYPLPSADLKSAAVRSAMRAAFTSILRNAGLSEAEQRDKKGTPFYDFPHDRSLNATSCFTSSLPQNG